MQREGGLPSPLRGGIEGGGRNVKVPPILQHASRVLPHIPLPGGRGAGVRVCPFRTRQSLTQSCAPTSPTRERCDQRQILPPPHPVAPPPPPSPPARGRRVLALHSSAPSSVMAGLVPAIPVLRIRRADKAWIPGPRPGMTVGRGAAGTCSHFVLDSGSKPGYIVTCPGSRGARSRGVARCGAGTRSRDRPRKPAGGRPCVPRGCAVRLKEPCAGGRSVPHTSLDHRAGPLLARPLDLPPSDRPPAPGRLPLARSAL
jgi:hypothetical protein